MLQTVLNDFKLQLSYGSDDLTAVQLAHKELCDTFVHQLCYTFIQLFLMLVISLLAKAGITSVSDLF